jgi:hypothetical protein
MHLHQSASGLFLERHQMNGQIRYNEKGDAQSFSGENAVDIFRAATLASALGLLKVGIGIRGLTKTRALMMATEYTGVKYKRGEFDKARDDLKKIIALRKQHVEHIPA